MVVLSLIRLVQRVLNGTRLMVHAGNCWQGLQFLAVFCCFVAGKFQNLESTIFRSFLGVVCSFLHVPLSAHH